MRVIIAGGRDYRFSVSDRKWLGQIHQNWNITEVISGMASGADSEGVEWAKNRDIPIKPFPADWENINVPNAIIKYRKDGKPYNANAGFHRNISMAKFASLNPPSALIVFPGGNGTQHMIEKANLYGVPVVISPSWY